MNEFITAIDVAKLTDQTIIGVGQKSFESYNGQMISFLDVIDCQMIGQMSYTDQVRYIAKLDGNSMLSGNYDLLVDATGIGEVVCDNLKDVGLNVTKILFTSGDKAEPLIRKNKSGFEVNEGWKVPKNELVDTLALLFQQRRIRIADGIPFEADIRKQLAHFTGVMSKNKNIIYNNDKDSTHDDIISMLAMMGWWFMQAGGARADFRYKEAESMRGRNRLNITKTADYDPFNFI